MPLLIFTSRHFFTSQMFVGFSLALKLKQPVVTKGNHDTPPAALLRGSAVDLHLVTTGFVMAMV